MDPAWSARCNCVQASVTPGKKDKNGSFCDLPKPIKMLFYREDLSVLAQNPGHQPQILLLSWRVSLLGHLVLR